jgi:hypothetical protein
MGFGKNQKEMGMTTILVLRTLSTTIWPWLWNLQTYIAVYAFESTFAAFNDQDELQKLREGIVFHGQNSSLVMSNGSSMILADAQGILFLCAEI